MSSDDQRIDTEADDAELQRKHQVNSELGNLAISDPTGDSFANEKDLSSHTPELVQSLYTEDVTVQIQAIRKFRKLLSDTENLLCESTIKSGAVEQFVHFLEDSRYPELQFESAWILTNIASGPSAQTQTIIDSGAVPVLIRLLSSASNEKVVEQSVWTLGNIANDSWKSRDLLLNSNVLPSLLGIFNGSNLSTSLMRTATWTLSSLCCDNPPPNFEQVSPCLPLLARLVVHEDDEVLKNVCQALSRLCIDSNDPSDPREQIQVVIDSGVCPRAVQLLSHSSTDVVEAALDLVCNITTGIDSQTQALINANVLPALGNLLVHEKESFVKDSCWTLSNITTGNKQQVQAVIDANILPSLVELLHHGNIKIRKAAGDVIANATDNRSEEQIARIVEAGAIPALCKLLSEKGSYMIKIALDGLDNILRTGKSVAKAAGSPVNPYATLVKECGFHTLVFLQFRNNLKIRIKVLDLLTMI